MNLGVSVLIGLVTWLLITLTVVSVVSVFFGAGLQAVPFALGFGIAAAVMQRIFRNLDSP